MILYILVLLACIGSCFPATSVCVSGGVATYGGGSCHGDIFLKSKYVELGLSYNGSFGTNERAPIGFATSGTQLGFISDGLKNGFDHYTGDYFMQGRYLEGWYVEYTKNGIRTRCIVQSAAGRACATTEDFEIFSSGTTLSAQWEGKSNDDLEIHIKTSLNDNDLFVTVDVELENISGEILTDIWYVRTIDANLEYATNGIYSGYNYVQYQNEAFYSASTKYFHSTNPSVSMVNSVGYYNYNHFLALGSTSPYSRVNAYGHDVTDANELFGPTEAAGGEWLQYGGAATNPYEPYTNAVVKDISSHLGFNMPSMSPNGKVEFSFVYVFSSNDVETAISGITDHSPTIAPTTPPTALFTSPTVHPTLAPTLPPTFYHSYNYSGSVEYFVVPMNINSIIVTACGGSGGASSFYGIPGGLGGCIEASISVIPGEVLNIKVGGNGSGGYSGNGGYNGGGDGGAYYYVPNNGAPHFRYGGGGGGATSLLNSAGVVLLVAGGGGGGAYYGSGGMGGGSVGNPGVFSSAGTGGTAGKGGTGYIYSSINTVNNGLDGSQLHGGGGAPNSLCGGGGGGWYGGGGGGGRGGYGGAGGGGSSSTIGVEIRSSKGVAYAGSVVLRYTSDSSAVNLAPTVEPTASPTAASSTMSTNFAFTEHTEYFTVPSGVSTITFTACGAKGSKDSFYGVGGGLGGCIKSEENVAPGDVLEIKVGGPGRPQAGGYNGGGDGGAYNQKYGGSGGGATTVASSSGAFIIVAGGGGGGGYYGRGGEGGSEYGSDGEGNNAGGGATITSGGTGYMFSSPLYNGRTGEVLLGGDGAANAITGGGGGGWYGGGGGGGSTLYGGGGGGGSSYATGNIIYNNMGGSSVGSLALEYTMSYDIPTLSPSSPPTPSPSSANLTIPEFFVGRGHVGLDIVTLEFGGLLEGNFYDLSMTVETYDDWKLGIGTDLWDVGVDSYSIMITMYHRDGTERSDYLAIDASHLGSRNYSRHIVPTRDATLALTFTADTSVSGESILVSELSLPYTYLVEPSSSSNSPRNDTMLMIIAVAAFAGCIFLFVIFCSLWFARGKNAEVSIEEWDDEAPDPDLPDDRLYQPAPQYELVMASASYYSEEIERPIGVVHTKGVYVQDTDRNYNAVAVCDLPEAYAL